MYDRFEPLHVYQKTDFQFQPSRYEMWMKGEMVSSGRTSSAVEARRSNREDEPVIVTFRESLLESELAFSNEFDAFVSSGDRLQLIVLPKSTNVQNMGITMLSSTYGATRPKKDFKRNEPYCCNIFLEQGSIVKITFSYSNPEKLLELYQ